jgi:hypothetical protein
MSKQYRPAVVWAWMNHFRTPFISERLKNGKIRLVSRMQFTEGTVESTEAQHRELYGKRWLGISKNFGTSERRRKYDS